MGGREDVYRNEAKRESEERLKWKQRRGRNGEGVLVAWVEGRGGREICVNKAKKEKGWKKGKKKRVEGRAMRRKIVVVYRWKGRERERKKKTSVKKHEGCAQEEEERRGNREREG